MEWIINLSSSYLMTSVIIEEMSKYLLLLPVILRRCAKLGWQVVYLSKDKQQWGSNKDLYRDIRSFWNFNISKKVLYCCLSVLQASKVDKFFPLALNRGRTNCFSINTITKGEATWIYQHVCNSLLQAWKAEKPLWPNPCHNSSGH